MRLIAMDTNATAIQWLLWDSVGTITGPKSVLLIKVSNLCEMFAIFE